MKIREKFCKRCFKPLTMRVRQATFCIDCVIFKDKRRIRTHNKWANVKAKRIRQEVKDIRRKYYDINIRGIQ